MFNSALTLIKYSTKIAIIPHRSPDGDAIGSAVALKLAIKQLNIPVDTVCIDPPPQNTKFLVETDKFLNKLDINNYDLLIFVDCGASYMSKFHDIIPTLLTAHPVINIDHHDSNDFFGKINLVDPHAASTTQILYNLFVRWEINITPDIATALLTGLYFDTGSFKHNNTTREVLKISADLTHKGANIKAICKNLFQVNSIPKLKLWGHVLKEAKLTPKNIVSSAVSQKDYETCRTDSKELEGVIDYLNAVPESKFSILVSEDSKGGVKGSLRTQQQTVDVSKIAELFGGGGHKMAAGFRIPASLQEEKYWAIH